MKELPVEIIVGDGKPLTNASVPVRWCIGPKTLQKIKDECGEYDAVVLVVAIDDKGYESRMVAPLSQGMGYLNLNRAGINKIYGMICYNDENPTKNHLRKILLDKESRLNYYHQLEFNSSKGAVTPYFSVSYSYVSCTEAVEVDIPKELFGKEPPEWFKGLVNTWQNTHVDDQCAWRRRLMFFVFVKSWAMLSLSLLVYVLNFGLLLVSVLFGFDPRQFNFRWVKHPIIEQCGGNTFPTKNHITIDKNDQFVPWRLMFVPMIWIVTVGAGLLIGASFVNAFIFAVSFLLTVPVALYAIVKMLQGIEWLSKNVHFVKNSTKWLTRKIDEKQARLIERDKLIAAEKYKQSEDFLSCKVCDKIASVALVPRQNMTIRLRYEQIKNAVCKPMQW